MQLAGFGVNLVVDAKITPTTDLINIVGSIGLKDGHVTIRNAQYKPTTELMLIAKVYPRNITFDCTEYGEK